jgi:hypothetical protein
MAKYSENLKRAGGSAWHSFWKSRIPVFAPIVNFAEVFEKVILFDVGHPEFCHREVRAELD